MALSAPCPATSEHHPPVPDESAGFLFYDPTPLPSPPEPSFVAQELHSLGRQALAWVEVAALTGGAAYFIGRCRGLL